MLVCSGRLIRTLADAQYGTSHLTIVEIIYNVISLIIAVLITIAFTVYAKRALDEIKNAETNGENAALPNNGSLEMEKLPLERPKPRGSSSILS